MTNGISLYDAIKAAGIPHDSHESDLYFPVTPESTALLLDYPMHATPTFRDQRDGSLWYEAPFEYTPWWEERRAK